MLSGGVEMLHEGRVDLVVAGHAAKDFLGQPLMTARFIAVAHPEHALHRLGRPLDLRDLKQHRQLVLRDSALHIVPLDHHVLGFRKHSNCSIYSSAQFSIAIRPMEALRSL